MGDRIVVEVFNDIEAVSLYCHWLGLEALTTVQTILNGAVARDRWDDPGYFTRIIFQGVIGPDVDSTGFGIYPGSSPMAEYPNLQLYPSIRGGQVKFGENKWTFEEFCEADIEGFTSQWWEDDRIENYEQWAQNQEPAKLDDKDFRKLLDLSMSIDVGGVNEWQEATRNLLDAESFSRGYDDWVVAYHEFSAS